MGLSVLSNPIAFCSARYKTYNLFKRAARLTRLSKQSEKSCQDDQENLPT